MTDVANMSDAQLRAECISHGLNPGPVNATTRVVYEKKLVRAIADAKSGKAPKPKTPAKVAVPVKKTPTKTVVTSASRNTTLNRSTKSIGTAHRSEIEEESDEDEIEDEEEEVIVSPKRSAKKEPVKLPFASTPTKKRTSEVFKPVESAKIVKKVVTPSRHASGDSVVVPGLITSFEPSFSTDRPGATPPRIYGSSAFTNFSSATKTFGTPAILGNNLHDLGATTEEDDDDGDECVESSRIVYSDYPKSSNRGVIGKAWDNVIGKSFKASSTPGQSYEFRTGVERTTVTRNKKTGKMEVNQSNIFWDSAQKAVYILAIIFVALLAGYLISSPQYSEHISKNASVVFKSVQDACTFVFNYAVVPLVGLLLLAGIAIGGYFGHKKYKAYQEEEEAKFYGLIDEITDIVRDAAELGEGPVRQVQTRDDLFKGVYKTDANLKRWDRAVAYIDANESRIATEIMLTDKGVECATWKWIGVIKKRPSYR